MKCICGCYLGHCHSILEFQMATAIVTAKIQLMQSEESSQRFLGSWFPPSESLLSLSALNHHIDEISETPFIVLAFIIFPCCLPWEFLPGSLLITHQQLLAWLFKPRWPHQARPAWQLRWHTRQRNTGVRDRSRERMWHTRSEPAAAGHTHVRVSICPTVEPGASVATTELVALINSFSMLFIKTCPSQN